MYSYNTLRECNCCWRSQCNKNLEFTNTEIKRPSELCKQTHYLELKEAMRTCCLTPEKETRKDQNQQKTWSGPYVVTTVTSKGVATMEKKDGKPLRTKHNIKNLKKYKTRERDGDLNNHCV